MREVLIAQAFIFADEELLVHAVDPHKKEDPGDTVQARGDAPVDHFRAAKDIPGHDEDRAERGDDHGASDFAIALAAGDVGQREEVAQSKDPADDQHGAIGGRRAILRPNEDLAVEHCFLGERRLPPVAATG